MRHMTPVLLASLAAIARASNAPYYNPNQNFRPSNVTGLIGLYAWVGSYYNGTIELELSPVRGYNGTTPACPALENTTTTITYNAVLAITAPGLYDSGNNTVNMFLAAIAPNYSLSSYPLVNEHSLAQEFVPPAEVPYILTSSQPTWSGPGNLTNVSQASQYLNLTLTPARGPPYNLSSNIDDPNGYSVQEFPQLNVTMPPCDESAETDQWSPYILTWSRFWSVLGWNDFQLPLLDLQFDGATANLSMQADFQAMVNVPANLSFHPGLVELDTSVQGPMKLRFSGRIDAYHSDVLETTSTEPRWLRTVGFGNNSMNIDYRSESSPRASLNWTWAMMACVGVSAAVLFS